MTLMRVANRCENCMGKSHAMLHWKKLSSVQHEHFSKAQSQRIVV